jgi:hypothetical protein
MLAFLQGKLSMLEAAASCTLVPCDTVFSVHTTFCYLCLVSLNTTGCPDLTGVHRLPWFLLLTLTTWSLAVVLLAWKWHNEVSWRHRHLMIWHHFFSDLQGTLQHGQQSFEEIKVIHQCFLPFIKYWYYWKVFFLDESPEIHLPHNS